jgi:hypothetical protein
MLIEIDAYIMALRRLGEALNRMRERGYVEDPRFRAALWLIADDLQACCPAALEVRKGRRRVKRRSYEYERARCSVD